MLHSVHPPISHYLISCINILIWTHAALWSQTRKFCSWLIVWESHENHETLTIIVVQDLLEKDHTSVVITSSQVRREQWKLWMNKAMGPDNINPRLLKACAGQVFQHFFNLSLRLKKVPQLWKTYCIVPMPKIGRPSTLNGVVANDTYEYEY